MKKLLFLLFAFAFSLAASAQTSFNGKIADSTLTNTQTANFTKVVTGAKQTLTFVYAATNTSGTTAASVTLYGTTDGINYVQMATDTISGTGNFARTFAYNPYAKYKVTIAQTGSSATNYKVFVLYR